MSAYDSFYNVTKHKNLYNITPLKNIPSIMEKGILCYDAVQKLNHHSIAMDDVQKRRDSVIIPGGLRLHKYANLYFTYNNPMLYKRKDMADDICILALSAKVLDIDNCIVSDQNAATSLVRFFAADEGIRHLNFELIFAQYWTDTDKYQYIRKKHIKCAEILIPEVIPYSYVVGACVISEKAKQNLIDCGFDRDIIVNPQLFYR